MDHRDALITEVNNKLLVVTADNSAGIGQRPNDIVEADPDLVGALTARVALLESVSLGAWPQAVSCTLSFPFATEMGQAVVAGVKGEMSRFNLAETKITGSSESNFPATVTAVGITVISWVEKSHLLLNKLQENDSIFIIGRPYVGQEVVANLSRLPDNQTLKKLTALAGLHEVIPCGSQGIRAELQRLTENNGWSITEQHHCSIDLTKSAGPASCLIAIGELDYQTLSSRLSEPVNYVGYLRRKNEKNI